MLYLDLILQLTKIVSKHRCHTDSFMGELNQSASKINSKPNPVIGRAVVIVAAAVAVVVV